MWQLFQGWQVWDGISGCKKGQKVGWQKLCHLAKSRGALLGLTLASGLAAALHEQKLPLRLPLRRRPRQVASVVRAARANQASPRNPRGLSSRPELGVESTRIPPPFARRMRRTSQKTPSQQPRPYQGALRKRQGYSHSEMPERPRPSNRTAHA